MYDEDDVVQKQKKLYKELTGVSAGAGVRGAKEGVPGPSKAIEGFGLSTRAPETCIGVTIP